MSELQSLRSEARALSRSRCAVPPSLRLRLAEAEAAERARVRDHRRSRRLGAPPVVRARQPVPELPAVILSLPPASRVRGVERRVRLFQRCKGWRFVFEVLEAEGWRQVQEREPGSSWSAEEAVKRASVYAELVGAKVVR
jgi:hypothetical protein